jgi:uncharacterized damage-inducible protein DinB
MRDAVDSLGLARTLIDYNEWASERLLRAADGVPDEIFNQPLPGAGHGSIFGQLRHIAYVQLNYLAGLEGKATDMPSAVEAVRASGVDFGSAIRRATSISSSSRSSSRAPERRQQRPLSTGRRPRFPLFAAERHFL